MTKSLVCRIEDLEAALAGIDTTDDVRSDAEIKAIALACVQDNARTLEECAGPFVWSSNPTGWLAITAGTRVPAAWTDVVGTTADPWRTLLTATSPACVSDLAASWNLGYDLHYARRARIYHLVGIRLLVNGAAVYTNSAIAYPYSDERSDTNPDVVEPLQYEWDSNGPAFRARQNVPAGATVELQVRHRVREAAAQASAWSRAYVGLRSHGMATFVPRPIVTGEQ